jgi:predicted RNA-binding Zn-ribbon protein involved in translation (DUF1610 family)
MIHLPTHVDVQTSLGEHCVNFRCPRCRFETQALVAATGTGLAINGLSMSTADLDARVDAARSLELCPCPRCGHRSRSALGKVLLLGAVVGALAGAVTGLIVAEQFHTAAWGGDLGFVAGSLAFLSAEVVTLAYKLSRARRRVTFVRPS